MSAPTVAVLRAEDRATPLANALLKAGAVPVLCPLIAHELPEPGTETAVIREGLARLAEGAFSWVAFTSVTTVSALLAIAAHAADEGSSGAASQGGSQAHTGEETAFEPASLADASFAGAAAAGTETHAAAADPASGAGQEHVPGSTAPLLQVAPRTKVAAVGKATARALRAAGVRVDLIPSAEHSARGLLADWPAVEDTAFAAVWLPAADLASPKLRDGLLELGWRPEDAVAYRTVPAPARPELALATAVRGANTPEALPGAARMLPDDLADALSCGLLDAAVLTSPSTARRVAQLLDGRASATGYIAIGPRTADEATGLGLRIDAISASTDPVGLADALAARDTVVHERNPQ
ncbi:uroporphyrinogen-III synthase [Galactobacter caseinivorans]|uniref:Uroporphyrinogen-III synthase n=1 Tax=Galactobacter caseinivorans TaxID=2676123 RepID=A0A496PM46_9MICC|nr:uroporphyrinogen-III synthase [Galactobacter caseinivorans]RKW71611.1 uroporphyrinogen-III synthase [Galactobacter caseinivorans]